MQRVADALRHQLVVILHVDRDIPLVLLQPVEMTSHVPLGDVAFPRFSGVYLEPAVSPLEPLWKCVGFVTPKSRRPPHRTEPDYKRWGPVRLSPRSSFLCAVHAVWQRSPGLGGRSEENTS